MSYYYSYVLDKFKNAHFTINWIPDVHEFDDLKRMISESQQFKFEGIILSVFVNIPMDLNLNFSILSQILPANFPISPIRDEQKRLIRFIDAPPSVPTGGNCDLGATAIIYDPTVQKVLTVTNARNKRLQYPGGRFDYSDGHPKFTAIRECKEEANFEIDINTSTNCELLGVQHFLKNQFVPGINFVYLFIIEGASKNTEIRPDGHEISSVQWLSIPEVEDILPKITENDLVMRQFHWSSKQKKKDWYDLWGNIE